MDPETCWKTAVRIGWDFIGRLVWEAHTNRHPKRARARIGK